MKKFDIELSKIIDSAIKSTEDLTNVSSLKELYERKKQNLNLSDRQIQLLLGMDKKTLEPILNAEAKQINFINIIKLAHFLGISINDLSKIYIPEMNVEQIGEIERAREAGFITEYFDVSTLTRMKFLKSGASSKEISERLKAFFDLDSIYSYSDNITDTAFSRTKRNSNDFMRYFWVQSALKHFEVIDNPYDYNREELVKLIPKIRPYTRDIKYGLLKVIRALYAVGVTVIYQPTVDRLQVRGATISVNEKPCVVISNLNNNYPTIWFTLLHELHHVLFDFEEIAKRVYHITSQEGDVFLMDEEKADSFAKRYLLNDTRYKFVRGYITSELHINRYAKEWGLHPSIIYAIHCFETNEWAFYNKFIPKMDSALELLNTHPFEQESLIESAKKIKEIISI